MSKQYDFFNTESRVIAHRGDSKYFPENSLLAFKSAIELGVDIIETDVHISSDGVIFVWHDENTEQLNGDTSPINTKSWEELQKLDLGYLYIDNDGKRPFSNKGVTLTPFVDVLEAFPNVRFNVDLKDKSRDLVEGFCKILEDTDSFNRVIVASFHTENLKYIRTLSDRVVTSFGESEVRLWVILCKLGLLRLVSKFFRDIPPVIQVPVSSGSLKIVTKRFLNNLHRRGVRLQVWTINERHEMEYLYKLGVDGIMTDDPRLLIEVNKVAVNT